MKVVGAVQIIGIDCAVDPKNVGVCRAMWSEGTLSVLELHGRASARDIASMANVWLADEPRALFALDAPLGWPVPLAEALLAHQAGQPMPHEANELFRRLTDDVVATRLKKRPLDVGADRIARTAYAALELLRELRWTTDLAIPLGWSPGIPAQTSAIEVYPAGTLKARGLASSGYKGAGNQGARRRLVEELLDQMVLDADVAGAMVASDHLLDAVLCALAGLDYVQGNVMVPPDLERARREGWIWVRPLHP